MEVRLLRPEEWREAAGVAARSLIDFPAFRRGYGEDPTVRLERIYQLYDGLVPRPDTLVVGALAGGHVIGMARAAEPGSCPYETFETLARSPEETGAGSETALWHAYDVFIAAHDPKEPHWHIAPVGVEPAVQGRGIGTAVMGDLLQRMNGRREAMGWLESEERNVSFYGRLGFEVIERQDDPVGVPTAFMRWRPP